MAVPAKFHQSDFTSMIHSKPYRSRTRSLGVALAMLLVVTAAHAATVPSIFIQPQSQTVIVGQTARFSVFAMGTQPLSFQWSRNGAAISGE